MSSVSVPPRVWDLVVEKSRRGTFTELLESEPFDWVWLLSLSPELHWGPFGMEVSHGVVPGLSGVSIKLPSVSLLSSSPVWDSDSLHKIFRVEVLSPNMVHDIWLLVEFLTVEVLNSDSDFSTFLNMESIGTECNVWISPSDCVGNNLFNLVSWVEDQFNPSSSTSVSNVVLEWSAQLSLAHEVVAYHFV